MGGWGNEMFKAIFLGALLTAVLSLVIGSQGTSAGYAAIHQVSLEGHKAYWSWPIFFFTTGIWWSLTILQR